MTNKEKYKEQIFNIACQHQRCAIVRTEHFRLRFQPCNATQCRTCIFYNNTGGCRKVFMEWLEKDANEFDWSKVEVDTKILVSCNNKTWHKAYFAFYDVENGSICVFPGGKTSFTNEDCNGYLYYPYAKLYDPEVKE